MKKKKENKNLKGYKIALISIPCVFVIWTILVCFHVFDGLNDAVHNFIFSCFSETATNIFKTFTFLGSTAWVISFTGAIAILCFFLKKFGKSVYLISIISISTIINSIIKVIIREPRPKYMLVNETTFSFPSGHSMTSVALYGLLIYLIFTSTIPKKYKWFYSIVLGIIPLGVMSSRIYLGAHYFSDVFGGVLGGVFLIILGIYLNKKYDLIEKLNKVCIKAKK